MKVSTKQYASTLYELTKELDKSQIDEIITKFVVQMKKNDDFKKAQDIIIQFEKIYNEKNDIAKVNITITRELTDNEKKDVIKFIKKRYKVDTVELNCVIDKDIKGGIVIRVRDEILDGSVNAKLRKLKLSLSK